MSGAVAFFDEAARTREGAVAETFAPIGHTARHVIRVIWAMNRQTEHGTLLDLGCGIGRLTIPVARAFYGWRVVGVDASPNMIRWAEHDARGVDGVEFLVGDGLTLPTTGPLAGWWSVLLFQHLPHEVTAAYLAQLAQRLPEGAPGIFQYVEGTEQGPLSHQATQAQVEGWCAGAGFDIVSVRDDDPYSADWRWVEVRRG